MNDIKQGKRLSVGHHIMRRIYCTFVAKQILTKSSRCVAFQATEKLVVFLFGVVQHQVADATWHSLGIDQGFLDTMGQVNFHGSFGDAHSVGDFGILVMHWYC
jgi:hypothetical protein